MSNENQKNQEIDQCNIKDHSKTQFSEFVFQGLTSGGSHLVANKAHGKTRLLFSMAQELRALENCRVLIFDGSETWLYAFNKIPVFTVSEHDIIETSRRDIQQFEKYSLQNAHLVKLALETNKDLLFRLKSRKPSKRGFFIRTVINYLDQQQRAEKQRDPNHENKTSIAYFLEEAQNAFNSRSTSSQENEEFLSVFNEARNMKEAFFTSSQRLNDFSKTIRSKQLLAIGKLSNEDINPFLRKIEKSIGLDFCSMKPRTWFFEGQTFLSPEFKQQGKPEQINEAIKEKWLSLIPKKKTLQERFLNWLHAMPEKKANSVLTQRPRKLSNALNEDENEDSQGDGLMLGFGEMFPEDF